MTEEKQRIAIAEACGIPIYEELGIRYKDSAENWGQSAEYTAQKCANYQRQGLGCELIKRKQTVDEFDPLHDLNAIITALANYEWEIYTCGEGYGCRIYGQGKPLVPRPPIVQITGENLCPVIAEAFLRAVQKWDEE